MARATFTLFDDNRLIHQSDLPEAGTNDLLAFSGVLLAPINVEDVRTARTLWVCVGARDGEVAVTVTHLGAGAQLFTVVPGRPLVIETISGLVDELLSIVIAPIRQPTVEILVYPGEEEEPPEVPTDALLVLNAAAGVEISDGRVDSWVDTRVTGITAPFARSDQGPIASISSAFNEQPVLVFNADIDTRLVSQDLPSVFDFLATGPFTILAVCSFSDAGVPQQGVSNESATGGGFMMGIDGGNRSLHRTTDDSGVTNNENTLVQELAPRPDSEVGKATIYIIRYVGTTMTVYRQGREQNTLDLGVTATSALEALVLGGSPDGNTFGGITIADLRLYDRRLSDEQRDGYISYALAQYGVDDTEAKQPPEGAVLMLRANRGMVVDLSDNVLTFQDTRPEASGLAAFESPQDLPDKPRRFALAGVFNGRPYFNNKANEAQLGPVGQLRYTGPDSDFDLLAGTTEATIYFVLRSEQGGSSRSAYAQMATGSGGGTGALQQALHGNNVGGEDGPYDVRWILRNDANNIISTCIVPPVIELGDEYVVMYAPLTDQPGQSILFHMRRDPTNDQQAHSGTASSTSRQFHIGPVVGDGAANLRIAEVRIYAGYHTAGVRNRFMEYIRERYGIPWDE